MRTRPLAALAALCVLTAQSPVVAPTTLPEIGRTHAKGFCTTVRDNVAPSVLGLMKTDELIGASHRAVLKLSNDQTLGSKEAIDLDRVYLNKVVSSMAHNLGVIKKLMNDEKRFPKTPVSDDDRLALLLKAQLQAAADRQNVALNHVNGILETTAIGQMRHDLDNGMTGSVADPSAKSRVADAISNDFIGVSALPGSGPGGMFDRKSVSPGTTRGHNLWDALASDVEVQQARVAQAEQTLTPTVIAAAAGCRGDGASPAPSP